MTEQPTDPDTVGADTATWLQEPSPPESTPQAEELEAAPDDAELDPRTRAYIDRLKRESQGLRARLRDAEELAGEASAQMLQRTREKVMQAAEASGLISGEDIFIAHPDANQFLDEEFKNVIPDRVRDSVEELLRTKPYLGRPVGRPPSERPLEGLRMGAAPQPEPAKTPSWSDALHG